MTADADLAFDHFTITVRRFKGGTWAVYIRYSDGSYEWIRGLVDEGHAGQAIGQALARVERGATEGAK